MRITRGLKILKVIVLLFGFLLDACSPKVQSSSSSSSYSEDLSSLRPKYELPEKDTAKNDHGATALANFNPQYDITDSLNAILDSISVLSKQISHYDGYAVQVYSGGNREAASIAKGKAFSLLKNTGEEPTLFYDAPNFKVHVGQFNSALEANKTFADLKKEFPNAILVLKKFKIERE